MSRSTNVFDVQQLAKTITRMTAASGFLLGVLFTNIAQNDLAWWVRMLIVAAEVWLLGLLISWLSRWVLRSLLMTYRSGWADATASLAATYQRLLEFKRGWK